MARENLNFYNIYGREMLVVPFDRNMVKAGKANIFVKNLGSNMTNKELFEIFKPFGEIFSVKLAQDFKGASKGYGYIQYRNIEDAQKAIKEMNGKEFHGKKLSVDFYKPGERKQQDPNKFTNVFVKNLPPNVNTNEELDKLFAPFGPRTSVGIFAKEFEGKPSYYGFVNFQKAEDAAAAVEKMNDKEINGVKLFATRALTKDQRERERIKHKIELRNQSRKFTLHVKHKNEALTEALIKQELEAFGEIKSITIQKNKTQEGTEVNSQIGYVMFAKSEDAERAAAEYRKDGPIEVNVLEGKEQRHEKIQQQRMGMNRFEYGSMPMFGMRDMGMMRGMPRMPRMPGRGARGRPNQRQFARPPMRGMMPPFGPQVGMRPMQMPMQMMQPPYPGFMQGGPYAMAGPMGPMPGPVPTGMQPGMPGMPGMPGAPLPMTGPIPGQGMPGMMPMGGPFMGQMISPQQPPQAAQLPAENEALGEELYGRIERLAGPEYF